MSGPLKITRDDRVVRVLLDRPDAGNAIDEATLDGLIVLLDEIRFQKDIRVLTLSAAGADFCLGGDRAELLRLAEEDTDGGAAPIQRVADKAKHACETLSALSAVTIARLHGRCMGAGMLLALSCDLRVGTRDSSFRLPELALGMPTAWGGGLARLVSELGIARTRELVLVGDTVTAGDAREYAILNRVAENTADAENVVDGWIRPLLRRSESALRATKDLLNAYAGSTAQGNVAALDSLILSSVVSSRVRPRPRPQEPVAAETPSPIEDFGWR